MLKGKGVSENNFRRRVSVVMAAIILLAVREIYFKNVHLVLPWHQYFFAKKHLYVTSLLCYQDGELI